MRQRLRVKFYNEPEIDGKPIGEYLRPIAQAVTQAYNYLGLRTDARTDGRTTRKYNAFDPSYRMDGGREITS